MINKPKIAYPPPDDLVELKFGENGFQAPADPRLKGPALTGEGPRRGERMCMKAKRLEIRSDGDIGGTVLVVDGVVLGGVTRFEMVVSKGYRRVSAVVTMKYDREDIGEYAEQRGAEVRHDDGSPSTVIVDVFTRQ